MPRVLLSALLVVVCAFGGIAGASALVSGAPEEPSPGSEAVQPDDRGSRVDAVARDPGDEPAWATRVYRSQTGLICPQAGRVLNGRFGAVDQDGTFRPLPEAGSGTCGRLDGGHPLILAADRLPSTTGRPAATVVFGAASQDVAGVAVIHDERRYPAVFGPDRTFVVPLADVAVENLQVQTSYQDGEVLTQKWGEPAR